MSDQELEQILGKLRKLRQLQRARERVKQLERELRGEPGQVESARREESNPVPEFLRARATSAFANLVHRSRSAPRGSGQFPFIR